MATEAVRALLCYALVELSLPSIDSGAAFDNIASKRVMEKIGMRYLGIEEEEGHPFTMKGEAFSRSVR